MPVGLYISVPFCRTKCSYCNFASGVFSRTIFESYVARLCSEIESARETASRLGVLLGSAADSIYFGGGTPTLLDVAQLQRIFVTIRQNFELHNPEITVECAPGTLTQEVVEGLSGLGVNRVSLGVQSFVDREAASVGRLHGRDIVINDMARLRASGIININVDLIAGLPHQTRESWEESLNQLIATDPPHASIYMLEVDDDSRLGRELIAGGQRYHAHFVPDDELTADFYELACQRLSAAGIEQYEISNFARSGCESRHNLKYWTLQPYIGFGVDAHSMLPLTKHNSAVRFSNPDSLEKYIQGEDGARTFVSADAALEEHFFVGLRLNRGVDLDAIADQFGPEALQPFCERISELADAGLITRAGSVVRLTPSGRLLSNEVFQRFVSVASESVASEV